MNAKANFINSVTDGQKIPCPICNTLNKTDATFCISCGNKFSLNTTKQMGNMPVNLEQNEQQQEVSAFEPVRNSVVTDKIEYVDKQEPSEAVSVFAQGLPSWDIIPPQIMVRRKRR